MSAGVRRSEDGFSAEQPKTGRPVWWRCLERGEDTRICDTAAPSFQDQDFLTFFDSSRGGFGVVLKTAPKTIPTTASGIPAKTSTPSIVFTTAHVTPAKIKRSGRLRRSRTGLSPAGATRQDPVMTTFSLQALPDDAAGWLDLARRAEEIGFEALYVADHPGSCAAPFVALAAAAAVTSRLRLGSYVANAGVREPILLAADVATLDVVSGGRAVLGLGAGHTPAEWAAVGKVRPGVRARIDH
jgi:hypothetical protein